MRDFVPMRHPTRISFLMSSKSAQSARHRHCNRRRRRSSTPCLPERLDLNIHRLIKHAFSGKHALFFVNSALFLLQFRQYSFSTSLVNFWADHYSHQFAPILFYAASVVATKADIYRGLCLVALTGCVIARICSVSIFRLFIHSASDFRHVASYLYVVSHSSLKLISFFFFTATGSFRFL